MVCRLYAYHWISWCQLTSHYTVCASAIVKSQLICISSIIIVNYEESKGKNVTRKLENLQLASKIDKIILSLILSVTFVVSCKK